MAKKIRQITDSIHQTVFLSELESQMMSTPYFYRLHDVYQSSTVYLSFPCNRTKRYEHSYGVMDVAGKTISSAVTNADEPTLDVFFNQVEEHFSGIIELFADNNTPDTSYCKASSQRIGECFFYYEGDRADEMSLSIKDTIYRNPHLFADMALSHYFPPIYKDVDKRRFLYQLILESVRLTALFHDVGHPPFSHIIEHELKRIYVSLDDKNVIDKLDNKKASYFKKCLSPFIESGSNKVLLLTGEAKTASALHEVIGLKMFNVAFDSMLGHILDSLTNSDYNADVKMAIIAYYVALGEFCNSIICEKDDFYISLHRIVDGCIDADRMDYVVRDTLNSGVNWGGVPYKRILESSKLSEVDTIDENGISHHFYVVAYHRKMVEDIEDFLLTRYKIFSRVNYHHKSFKTGLILQKIVRELVYDYLSKNGNEHPLCPEIKNLWGSLRITQANKDLNVIQWNDSSLIANLYKTLVDMNEYVGFNDNINSYYKITKAEYRKTLNLLEEFLLNQKHYQPVFKRPSDLMSVMDNVITQCSALIDQVKTYETTKEQKSTNQEDIENASDSLKRLTKDNLENVRKSGDISAFENIFALKIKFEEILREALESSKTKGKITSYFFDINPNWKKLGLPQEGDQSDGIYLYNSQDDKISLYNYSNLEKQLFLLQKHCLQYIAYVYPARLDDTVNTVNEILAFVESRLIEEVTNAVKQNFTDLSKKS